LDLLDAWAKWEPGSPPFVLGADQKLFNSEKSQSAIELWSNWRNYTQDPRFGARGGSALHHGLIPQPFVGNVRGAKIYILLLNPGLGPHDYFGEYEVPEYREALLGNLKQKYCSAQYPFLFLDPVHSWHGGYQWWNGKLSGVIEELAKATGVSLAESRAQLAKDIASIELLPYHSMAFRDADGWLKNLPSVRLAREFVQSFVLDRVKAGKAIVVVTRKVSVWDLGKQKGIVAYTPMQSRAAHLTPASPGGRAILGMYGIRGKNGRV